MSDSAGAGSQSAYINLLGQVPFLTQVPAEDLATLAEHSVVRHYEAGQSIVVQGAFGHSMFVLVQGALTIRAAGDDGALLDLGRLDRPGDFFGEVALLGRGVRSATVFGDSPTILLEIEKNRFDRLARRNEAMVTELEKFYHARSIATYTRLHRYLGELDAKTLAELTAGATMRKFGRDDIVCKKGDKSDTVMLIKDGVLKMVRKSGDGRASILAYFNTHDVCGAHDGYDGRPADLICLGQAEIIFVKRTAFDRLVMTHPHVYARFGKDDMHRSEALAGAGQTVLSAADAFLKEGVEVESLLVIDLDRCVRCGNCVRACHDRHEFTRLDRRGPIFRRRQHIQSTKHQHLLIPSSCRHCRDPECMVDCPTGAIHRNPDGEVDINQNCIGCDNCARKCPYGNITMMPLPEAKQHDGVVKQAIKCNMCRGHEYSNCVYNCPRGAVLRVDPLKYFDELALIMESEQVEGLEWARAKAETSGSLGHKQRVKPRLTRFINISLGLFAFATAGIIAAFFASPNPRTGGSTWGLGFGMGATACIAFAMFLGARKRMRTRPIGNLEVWTQFHMVVGTLGFVAALAHSGFRITGVFTTLLLLIFAIEIISGFAGQIIYYVAPRILTRLERHDLAKLFEDLLEEDIDLSSGITEMSHRLPPEVVTFVKGPITRAAGSVPSRYKKSYEPQKHPDAMRKRLSKDLAKIAPNQRATVDRLIHDVSRRLDIRAQLRLHRIMKNWLVVHLAATGALAVFLVVHIVAMLLIM